MRKIILLGLALATLPSVPTVNAQTVSKNRVIILTDIEADPDDTQSLVRLLLYANQIEIKGIVATTSCWMKTRIAPESINKVINAYGKVQPNLLLHESGFPKAEALLSLVKNGPPVYGMQAVGDNKESEGSEWIIVRCGYQCGAALIHWRRHWIK